MGREVHLICNAHLDAMWLWEWEEGAAETISTFRTAARLAEEFDDFIFCHNEALLYEWIEEYEPTLFEKIKSLVKRGKWHIMGGWYLQPDCHMPSGEGFIRQIKRGNDYFREKFGVSFDTAVNFDSFGHSRGLVQIMAKCGYKNYLVCRPTAQNLSLPDEFVWVGYDGSEILVRRHYDLYNSALGRAAEKINATVNGRADDPLCILWGVGNHGGGPSKKDLEDIAKLAEDLKKTGVSLIHSTPDGYFEKTVQAKGEFERIEKTLSPCNTGCYSVQSLIKKYYRRLERELFVTEKMLSSAVAQGLMTWPKEIKEAERDMIFIQFHDILPGTAIKAVEDAGVRAADHGLEILSRLKTRAYFAHCNSIGYTPDGNYPVLVFNPLPYEVERTVEAEFQLADQNWEEEFTFMRVYDADGRELPCQIEKESSNLNLDWRKHVTFTAKLKPMCANLFVCKPYKVKKLADFARIRGVIEFTCGELKVKFNADTGLIEGIIKGDKNYITSPALGLVVWSDTEDPWAMRDFQDRRLGEKIGSFTLLDEEEGSRFSGVKQNIPSCRIIEDGAVRTVVEAVFGYGISRAQVRYYFNKISSTVEVEYKVVFGEKDKSLRVEIPVSGGAFWGREPFGREELRSDGGEAVFHDWCGVFDGEGLFAVNDSTYSGSYDGNVMTLTLLRTAAYTGHPILGREILLQDRYTDRIDLGERSFRFIFSVGTGNDAERLAVQNENKPMALSFFPHGDGESKPFIKVSDSAVSLASMYCEGDGVIIRLYNGSDEARSFNVEVLGATYGVELGRFEFATFCAKKGTFAKVDTIN